MNAEMSPQLRARIDAHLDAVERNLTAQGVGREKRRGILDDLEIQIREMLGSRPAADWSDAELDELFSKLDSPDSYEKQFAAAVAAAVPGVSTAGSPPTLCRQARKGAWWIASAIPAQCFVVAGLGIEVWVPADEPPPSGLVTGLVMAVLCLALLMSVVSPIVGTSLGWIAVERIRKSGENLYGLGLAVVEALLYPVLIAWILGFGLTYMVAEPYYHEPDVRNSTVNVVWIIGGTCVSLLFSGLLGWLLERLTRPARAANPLATGVALK